MTVVEGGFLAFIVQGTVEIGEEVDNIQGIYIADGELTINSGTERLFAEGTFVGWTDVTFGRENANYAVPAERFDYRPDLLLNAPAEFRKPARLWQEVAPREIQ
jgi:hypothetical protein